MAETGDRVWFEFVESEIFSKQVRGLAEVLNRIQSDLVENPERGAIVKGTHGVRKARVADPVSSRGKSGSYRYLYLYLHAQEGFTCFISLVKASSPNCRHSKRKSLAR